VFLLLLLLHALLWLLHVFIIIDIVSINSF